MSTIKPDLLINYNCDLSQSHAVAVIYVRPKTNLVKYEKEIIVGIQKYGEVVYLANLNGKLFIQHALILEHYATQYRFSIMGKAEISQYPEMVQMIEDHFKKKFDQMRIIGPFDAILELNLTADQLFNIIVDKKDFLRFYGQTIKKINNNYILNYNIPALLHKYTPTANIFVTAIRINNPETTFKEIDECIFNNMLSGKNTPIIDADKFENLEWNEKIRRTYHISQNHMIAIFDMLDFVFQKDGHTISLYDVPFARHLLEENIITEKRFLQLKDYNIVRINENGHSRLVNILEEANHKSMAECKSLLQKIIWE